MDLQVTKQLVLTLALLRLRQATHTHRYMRQKFVPQGNLSADA